jgi:carbonic anhydrase/acetyltransferase-like protein (isoleucine patch superfamily)
MPFWGIPGPNYKFVVQVRGGGSASGWMHCGIGDASIAALGHEFGMPCVGGGYFLFTQGNATQHLAVPGELQMFNGNWCYPWRNVNRGQYQSSFWFFVLGDNPHWGYGIPVVYGGMGSHVEWTPYHTIARLGQRKGLWKNGVRGFGDFFGEYAARMVTVDVCEQWMLRSRYGMPEVSYVYPVYGRENTFRVSNAEAPRWCGYNIIRLVPDKEAKEIVIDLHGFHDPDLHSDWRACIVAVDGEGRARYSPMWNKGGMALSLEPSDKRLWLTVSASPSAFPLVVPKPQQEMSWHLLGVNAPRYPWEASFTGCRPGTPNRLQGDVGNLDELYSICNQNKYLDYPTKSDVPIPLDEEGGKLAQEKLAGTLARIRGSQKAIEDKVAAGLYSRNGWWEQRKMEVLDDLERRALFLQRNGKGKRHPNGGGFVADNAHAAKTAYVGPDAMVLDGARVEDNACIKEFAVVSGPKAVISGHAKIGGRAWVSGDIKVSGNARILEAATVTATRRWRERHYEGQAEIHGNAVIKGDPYLYLAFASNQVITGSLVMDYGATVNHRASGVIQHGRFYQEIGRVDKAPGLGGGSDDGALYANWQFNQPKAVLMEDAYVNNNGILYGRPAFADDGDHHCIVFNGKDQYAEAPPSVVDFGELTIDMLVKREGEGGRVFDFGTGEDECFCLELSGREGKPVLTAVHGGKRHELAAAEGIPADKWVRIRVEMDGNTASVCADGKQVANGKFEFRPRDVFFGDRPEGNFIACDRERKQFFKGRIDHFRIYRAVHDDFAAVGDPPYSLTRLQEWCERDQERHDAWNVRRKTKDEELKAGRFGKIHEEIGKLQQQKAALKEAAMHKELDARIADLHKEAGALWEKTMREAGVFGSNPYPGGAAAALHSVQKAMVYHTTADWDDRTHQEASGEVLPKLKKWLEDVRGF